MDESGYAPEVEPEIPPEVVSGPLTLPMAILDLAFELYRVELGLSERDLRIIRTAHRHLGWAWEECCRRGMPGEYYVEILLRAMELAKLDELLGLLGTPGVQVGTGGADAN